MTTLVSKEQITRRNEEQTRLRLRTLANVFTKTDRILTADRKINVRILDKSVEGAPALDPMIPGASNYPNIWINASAFPEVNKSSTLVGLLGLNYHELSHLMFTPRGFKAQIERMYSLGMAFNILEDQRIESFFTALYEPAGKFFTETFVRFLMNDPNQWDKVFMFSYGRGFLPKEIRDEFEARFSHPELMDEIRWCIDEFKELKTFAVQQNGVAFKIIKKFDALLRQVNPPQQDCDGADQIDGKPDESASQEARTEDRKRRQREEKTGEDQSNFWDDDEEEDEDDEASEEVEEGDSASDDSEDDGESGSDSGGSSVDDDSEGADDDGEGDEESGGGDSEASGDGSDSEGEDGSGDDSGDDGVSDSSASSDDEFDDEDDEDFDDGDLDGENDGESSAGHQQTESEVAFSDEELKEYLGDISDAIEGDDAVRDEINRCNTAMNDNTDIDVIDFGQVKNQIRVPSASAIQAVNKITKDFSRLWAQVDPGWHYGSDVGRLNVGRAMSDPENYDEMFDEWDEGRENEVGLEVFIDLDTSGSMAGQRISLASEAMWVLKRSLDSVGAKTTVVGFDYHSKGLMDRNEEADRFKYPLWTDLGGDTAPAHSFKLARTLLSTSTMPNKLFVCITDGGWTYYDEELGTGYDYEKTTQAYCELIDSIPGTKMYVGVGGGGSSNLEQQEHFHFRSSINTASDLEMLVKQTVEQMIRERIR